MVDVILGLAPVLVAAVWLYRVRGVQLTAITVAACLLTEGVANRLRGRGLGSLTDGSAIVTGMILAFSLPPLLPAYMAFLGGVVAIALGKTAFGGLGQNLFNPAMVGRAFLMASFPVAMTTWARPFDLEPLGVDAMSGATPLAAAKFGTGAIPGVWSLFLGDVGGSIGETSVLAVLIGGVFLLLRGTADWRQPLGVLVGAGVFAAAAHLLAPDRFADVLVQLTSGALMFGAFFIATDPVGCPLTPAGRLVFGLGVGVLVMVIRLFGGYPEGVMFAVLLMNAVTPLVERWTRPVPFGGRSGS
jgi:electron transport complex protein RnfD